MTENAQAFLAASRLSQLAAWELFKGRDGSTFTLADGQVFTLSGRELIDIGVPKQWSPKTRAIVDGVDIGALGDDDAIAKMEAALA